MLTTTLLYTHILLIQKYILHGLITPGCYIRHFTTKFSFGITKVLLHIMGFLKEHPPDIQHQRASQCQCVYQITSKIPKSTHLINLLHFLPRKMTWKNILYFMTSIPNVLHMMGPLISIRASYQFHSRMCLDCSCLGYIHLLS